MLALAFLALLVLALGVRLARLRLPALFQRALALALAGGALFLPPLGEGLRVVDEAFVLQLDDAVDEWARRLAAKPEVAVHMTKTQLRALAARAALGDVTEADGDLLLGASRIGVARSSFSAGPGGTREPSS